MFDGLFDIEGSIVVVDEIDVFESDILMSFLFVCKVVRCQNLSLVGSSLDIISLIDVYFLVEDVSDDDEVNGPLAAFVFHFVKAVDSHNVGLRVFFDVVGVIFHDVSQFEILLSADGLNYNLGVFCIVDETP